MDFITVRVWFEKKGAVQYISHLDLTRVMARALKLSGLPLWYTEGFNPRIYMTYAMPLSLGIRGERECMDIRLTEPVPFDEIVSRLDRRLPADAKILEAAEPQRKFEEIQYAEYEVLLEGADSGALEGELRELLAMPQLLVMKHGKKGDREVDIKPYFVGAEIRREGPAAVSLGFRLPCGVQGSVNPQLLLEAMRRYQGVEPDARITRKRLLLKDFSEIR